MSDSIGMGYIPPQRKYTHIGLPFRTTTTITKPPLVNNRFHCKNEFT